MYYYELKNHFLLIRSYTAFSLALASFVERSSLTEASLPERCDIEFLFESCELSLRREKIPFLADDWIEERIGSGSEKRAGATIWLSFLLVLRSRFLLNILLLLSEFYD